MATETGTSSWADLIAEGRGARVALIALGIWLNAADSLVTSTIMPTVGRDLGGYAYFSWATAAYMVGAILSGATAARFSSRFGLRRAMVAAGLATALGCAGSALAPDMVWLVVGRLAQGLGAGWIVGACYAAIGSMFPQRHLARVFSITTGVWGVATVLGPMVGALFAEGHQWRALFWAFAAQCVAFAGAAVWLLPRDTPTPDHPTPWTQLALVLTGVGLLGAADLTPSVVAASALAAASLAAFIAAARYRPGAAGALFPSAAGDLKTLIGAAYLSYFALTAAAMCFSVYAPALLQRLYGLSPLAAGYAAGLEALGWTVAALAVAHLSEPWHGPIIRLGAACVVVSLAALAFVMRSGPLPAILVAATVMGAGFGFSAGFTGRRVIASAAEPDRELASAGINSVRQIGNAAGACLAGVIANLLGMTGGVSLAAAQASAVWLFALSVPVALLGAAGAWRAASGRLDPI
jgi:MFS family permease